MSRVLFSIGPIHIYYYSITMLLAIISGVYLTMREAHRQKVITYFEDLLFKLIIFGIIGARIYYVVFNFSVYKDDILSIFKIWEGGLAIYGAIIAGFITIIYNSKKQNISILKTTDIIVPGLILAQAIGRWGNFFNKEAHGAIVSLDYLKSYHLPDFIINGMYINGFYYKPTFLYESIWCLLGFIVLLILRNIIKRKEGIITYTYFIWYGIGRLIIEGLRTDSLYLGSIRISQLVSIILIMSGIIGLILSTIKNIRRKHETKS